jgi:hypothetical protein
MGAACFASVVYTVETAFLVSPRLPHKTSPIFRQITQDHFRYTIGGLCGLLKRSLASPKCPIPLAERREY